MSRRWPLPWMRRCVASLPPNLKQFHRDGDGRLALRYASVLMGMQNPLVTQLLINVIDRLVRIFPEQSGQLHVMRNNLAWRSIVQPAG